MSFLNRMMASVGIGSAKVDTRVDNAQVRAGDEVRGVVSVKGGGLEQQIDDIYIHVMTQYVKEVDDRRVRENVSLGKFRVASPFKLGAGETRELPFAFTLPAQTPVTVGHARVWLKTGLDIAMAVDPTDTDHLDVRPSKDAQVILDAVELLGFRLRQAEVEYTGRWGRNFPFMQQFEFVPTGGEFRGYLDEFEVVMLPTRDGVELHVEIDRKARGFGGFLAEAFDADESRLRIEFERIHLNAGPQEVARHLGDIIRRHSRH